MDNERFTLDYLYHFAKAMQAIKDEENKKDVDNERLC